MRKIQFKFPQIRNEFQGMLESEDWQQDSDFYTYGKVYKNVSPYIKIGGVNSAPTLENKKVTVPAVDSETQISLSVSDYNVSFNSAVNLLLDSKNTTIKTNYGSNTISDAQTQITSPVVGNDTTRTLTNGENITNILLERISGGDIFLSVDGTKIIYSIGGNLIKGTDNDGEELWGDGGYLDDFGYVVSVNWQSDDWAIELERDMFNNLMKAVQQFNINIDEPNFNGTSHSFDMFDKIHGIVR